MFELELMKTSLQMRKVMYNSFDMKEQCYEYNNVKLMCEILEFCKDNSFISSL